MKLFFLSNYFNHHQASVSDAFNSICKQYKFVSTSRMREERKKIGYGNIEIPSYVVDCSEGNNKKNIIDEVAESDVVIIGSAPEEYIYDRQKQKKLIFRYSERIYRKHYQWYKWPFRMLRFYMNYGRHDNTYLLCSSAFTAADYAKHFTFLNKTYKWGYFPETKRYESLDMLLKSKEKNSILWCGRFLECKHPDDVIKVLKRLKLEGYSIRLNFIGSGNMQVDLQQMIIDYDLEDCVHILGPMLPEQVREYMEHAGIYLFTSDRQEGWGAVLNEAMNSGCAVVASHEIGAVPYLVTDNENGLIYESGNLDMLYEKVKYLLEHPEEQQRLGMAAYSTIVNEWNAEVAAERFVNLAEHILAGETYPDLYETGPCSKAEIIKDKWFTK